MFYRLLSPTASKRSQRGETRYACKIFLSIKIKSNTIKTFMRCVLFLSRNLIYPLEYQTFVFLPTLRNLPALWSRCPTPPQQSFSSQKNVNIDVDWWQRHEIRGGIPPLLSQSLLRPETYESRVSVHYPTSTWRHSYSHLTHSQIIDHRSIDVCDQTNNETSTTEGGRALVKRECWSALSQPCV